MAQIAARPEEYLTMVGLASEREAYRLEAEAQKLKKDAEAKQAERLQKGWLEWMH